MWVTRHVTRRVIVSGIPLVNLIHGHPFQVVAFLLRSGTLRTSNFSARTDRLMFRPLQTPGKLLWRLSPNGVSTIVSPAEIQRRNNNLGVERY
jgi:hypothetical protein